MGAVEKRQPVDTGGVIIPAALSGLGIKIVESHGQRGVVLTPEVYERCNVVSPVSSVSRVDPIWTPALNLVGLRIADGYSTDKGKTTSLSKQQVTKLAEAAGITTSTRRMPPSDLNEPADEVGYYATARSRQPDGTPLERPGDCVELYSWLREEIELKCRADEEHWAGKDNRQPDYAKAAAKATERFLKERRFLGRKAETTAELRAIRNLMNLPLAVPTVEFEKPWLVFRYAFAPDLSDPVVRRAVIEHGLGATKQLYGASASASVRVGRRPSGTLATIRPIAKPSASWSGTAAAPAEVDPYDAEQAQDGAVDAETGEVAETDALDKWRRVAAAAGEAIVPLPKYRSKTIAQVFELDAGYVEFLAHKWKADKLEDKSLQSKARDYLNAQAALGGAS